ncbi:hypothetical protein B6U90_04075 [Thermoplasmatales archaeon ex4484_6]|nr:MAG: hypothetical protein B6U90_04075 [Thermoplasmatales archaeon ex4484_6]RLF69175.1 MAG: hypothetical protein DRN57_01515 [Thermoplasmata archaeon]
MKDIVEEGISTRSLLTYQIAGSQDIPDEIGSDGSCRYGYEYCQVPQPCLQVSSFAEHDNNEARNDKDGSIIVRKDRK